VFFPCLAFAPFGIPSAGEVFAWGYSFLLSFAEKMFLQCHTVVTPPRKFLESNVDLADCDFRCILEEAPTPAHS